MYIIYNIICISHCVYNYIYIYIYLYIYIIYIYHIHMYVYAYAYIYIIYTYYVCNYVCEAKRTFYLACRNAPGWAKKLTQMIPDSPQQPISATSNSRFSASPHTVLSISWRFRSSISVKRGHAETRTLLFWKQPVLHQHQDMIIKIWALA